MRSKLLVFACLMFSVVRLLTVSTASAADPTNAQLQAEITSLTTRMSAVEAIVTPPVTPPVTQPTTYPAWSPDPTYAVAVSIYYAPSTGAVLPLGSDTTGQGTQAAPYATCTKAITAAHTFHNAAAANATKIAAVYGRADGQSYVPPGNLIEPYLLIGCYGATAIHPRPTFIGQTYTAFLLVNSSNVHFDHIHVTRNPSAPYATGTTSAGIQFLSGDNNSVSYCEIDNQQSFGVCGLGAGKQFHCFHNFIHDTYDPNKQTESCTGLYTELVIPDVEANIFYRNGWEAPFDITDGTWISPIQFRHGWYESYANGAVAGIDKDNFYLRNAACGHQCRAGGGSSLWNVYWDNGNACDTFTGPGVNHKLGGEIGNCAFFGNLTKDFLCWGGGFVGQSVNDNVHDLIFSSPLSSMGIQPAIIIGWNINLNDGFPLPAGTVATITNCRGIWPIGDVSILSGRTATLSNVNIIRPTANQHTPTLLDWRGVTTEAALIADLSNNMTDPNRSAQAAVAWLGAKLPMTTKK